MSAVASLAMSSRLKIVGAKLTRDGGASRRLGPLSRRGMPHPIVVEEEVGTDERPPYPGHVIKTVGAERTRDGGASHRLEPLSWRGEPHPIVVEEVDVDERRPWSSTSRPATTTVRNCQRV